MTTATADAFTARPTEVHVTPAEIAGDIPELNYTKVYLSSIAWISILFAVGVGVPVSLVLDDWMGGMGLGFFTAFWGGPSFGVMLGSARVSAWQEKYGHE